MSLVLEVPKFLKKNGFEYNLFKRNRAACVYEQWKGGKLYGFEVFKHRLESAERRRNKGKKLGIKIPESLDKYDFFECFPGNEEFGKRAWSFRSRDDALKCLDELLGNSEQLLNSGGP